MEFTSNLTVNSFLEDYSVLLLLYLLLWQGITFACLHDLLFGIDGQKNLTITRLIESSDNLEASLGSQLVPVSYIIGDKSRVVPIILVGNHLVE